MNILGFLIFIGFIITSCWIILHGMFRAIDIHTSFRTITDKIRYKKINKFIGYIILSMIGLIYLLTGFYILDSMSK